MLLQRRQNHLCPVYSIGCIGLHGILLKAQPEFLRLPQLAHQKRKEILFVLRVPGNFLFQQGVPFLRCALGKIDFQKAADGVDGHKRHGHIQIIQNLPPPAVPHRSAVVLFCFPKRNIVAFPVGVLQVKFCGQIADQLVHIHLAFQPAHILFAAKIAAANLTSELCKGLLRLASAVGDLDAVALLLRHQGFELAQVHLLFIGFGHGGQMPGHGVLQGINAPVFAVDIQIHKAVFHRTDLLLREIVFPESIQIRIIHHIIIVLRPQLDALAGFIREQKAFLFFQPGGIAGKAHGAAL